ncbi:SMI1/KNR4 family protein [Sphingopyxis terrae]|uniref:SMI1/KNR4 family protein n=1 Tax=Sphingopyxis terrae TaxID=33052 RepID=UPI002A10835E|nr:SMI1/KNR4 family protein [Sphingopyxis terrae]MDX8356797.1 SMI1/KNR4 family protein [Sphingopyxis terrae]
MFEERDWHRSPGATAEALKSLRAALPMEMPASYFSLLSFSDGGEGPLAVQPFYLCLDPTAEIIERQSKPPGQSEFETIFIFGGNGGGEYLALDLRQEQPWPVISVDMIAGLESAEIVAKDFESFLDLVGVE